MWFRNRLTIQRADNFMWHNFYANNWGANSHYTATPGVYKVLMWHNLFCDFMFECNLSQLITCVKGNILDLLLTNNEHLISHLLVSESTSFLTYDHFLLLNTPPPQLNHKLCLITLMLTTKVYVIFNLIWIQLLLSIWFYRTGMVNY